MIMPGQVICLSANEPGVVYYDQERNTLEQIVKFELSSRLAEI